MLTQLETEGWVQGEYGPIEGPNCLVGAGRVVNYRMVYGTDQKRSPIWDDVRVALREQLQHRAAVNDYEIMSADDIIDFNDGDGRTYADIRDLLQATIKHYVELEEAH
jgi:hypothetical protein